MIKRQVLTYVVVGLFVALFQYVSFTTIFLNAGVTSLTATSVSFVFTVIVSYVLQRHVTFKMDRNERRHSISESSVLFILNALLGLVINGAVFFMSVQILSLSPYTAQGLSMVILATYNFFLYRLILT
jgi:putative flippase GtrA